MVARFSKGYRKGIYPIKKSIGDMNMSKELVVKDESNFMVENVDFGSMFGEEMEGMTPTFDRVRIPTGGGIAFEVPGDDPDSPDMAKEFNGVIVYHHPVQMFYKEKFDGANNPPDCGSMDGKFGVTTDGEIVDCKECPNAMFGSAEDGRGKACKQKRRIYVLREGEILPLILTLPTGSLGEFSKYIMRLLNKGKKSNSVVTKFSLKKAQNQGGITYSQAMFSVERELSKEEYECVGKMTSQIKAIATSVSTEVAE